MIQPQAERQFQVVGNPHIVGTIKAHLVKCDGLLCLFGEVLHNHIPGSPASAGYKVAQREFHDFRSHKLEGVIADVVAAIVDSNLECMPSAHPTEVIDEL